MKRAKLFLKFFFFYYRKKEIVAEESDGRVLGANRYLLGW